MRQMTIISAALMVTACSTNQIIVGSLDETIIEAAQQAKASGANELTLELSVTSTSKNSAGLSSPVVAVTGEKSDGITSKLIVKIANLKEWERPDIQESSPNKGVTLYQMNTKTLELKEIRPLN